MVKQQPRSLSIMPESAKDGKTKDLDENPGNILPLRMMSKVARGFGRGSSDLGIPTANLDRDALQVARPKNAGGILHDDIPSFDGLPCGIYWGFARVGENPKFVGKEAEGGSSFSGVYAAAVSIGYNPTYNNGALYSSFCVASNFAFYSFTINVTACFLLVPFRDKDD